MKRLFTTLLIICCMAAAVYGQNETDQPVDFQIVVQEDTGTPVYRAPAMVPVHGYYLSFLNALCLSFSHDLGVVHIEMENTGTGQHLSGYVPTGSGFQLIPLGSDTGCYTITITTSAGIQYAAELVL